MAHDHNIIDDDNQFTIDGVHRQVTNATGNRPSVQQFDHNCERLTFQMPRFVDGHDMMLCDRVEIHYTNTGKGTSISNRPVVASIDAVEDLAVSEDDENLLTFSWLIPKTATQYAGTLVFQFKFICNGETEEDPPAFVWHTAQYSFVDVLASLNITDVIVDGYPDLLAKLCTKVDNFALDIDSFRNDKLDSKDAADTYATIHSHIELREETQEALTAHVGNKENPHSVTLGQLGVDASAAELNQMLGGVEVPIQSQLDAKVIKGTSVVNSEASRVKSVPATSAPYAKVLEIGGKTRNGTNLFGGEALADRLVELGGTKDATNKTVTITASAISNNVLFDRFKPSRRYVFVFEGYNTSGSISTNMGVYFSDGTSSFPTFTDGKFTMATDPGKTITKFSGIWNTGSSVFYYEKCGIFEEALPSEGFEPYFSGLRSAAVSEVESVGVNLLAYPYKNTTKTVNGVTYTDNGDGSVSFSGTPTAYSDFSLYTMSRVAKGAYYLSLLGNYQNIDVYVVFLGSGDKTISEKNYITSGIVNVSDYPETTRIVFSLKRRDNGVACSGTMRIMLNEGTTAQPYAPYVRHALPIPAEVQGLDGYGWGVNANYYNYIDWEKKQFVKRVGCVDLGTLEWGVATDQYVSTPLFRTAENLPRKPATGVGTLLCAKYESAHNRVGLTDKKIAPYNDTNDNRLCVVDLDFSDAATFKAALTGVMLYYELAEPVVTDISDLLPADNYIGVEGGGTVTMVSEYGYDVPSKVVFYENSNDVIGADTFVGNLEGTAARAEADADGKQLASREWVLEQIAAMISQSSSTASTEG